jgi:hypothetical protein
MSSEKCIDRLIVKHSLFPVLMFVFSKFQLRLRKGQVHNVFSVIVIVHGYEDIYFWPCSSCPYLVQETTILHLYLYIHTGMRPNIEIGYSG